MFKDINGYTTLDVEKLPGELSVLFSIDHEELRDGYVCELKIEDAVKLYKQLGDILAEGGIYVQRY